MDLLRWTTLALAGACGLLGAGRAAAQDDSGANAATFQTAERATAAGVFMRNVESATTQTHRVAISTQTGYDGNRQGALVDTRGEVVLVTRRPGGGGAPVGLSIIGGGAYIGATASFPESSSVYGGLKLQPLFQEKHGIDAAIAVSYQSRGFNLQQAVGADLLFGRAFGDTQLLLNVGVGYGPEEGERYGRARVGVLTRIVDQLRIGVDARYARDLEIDEDEPTGEPWFEAQAGVALSYAISHVSLSANVGPAALRYRPSRTFAGASAELRDQGTMYGVVATLGIGGTL